MDWTVETCYKRECTPTASSPCFQVAAEPRWRCFLYLRFVWPCSRRDTAVRVFFCSIDIYFTLGLFVYWFVVCSDKLLFSLSTKTAAVTIDLGDYSLSSFTCRYLTTVNCWLLLVSVPSSWITMTPVDFHMTNSKSNLLTVKHKPCALKKLSKLSICSLWMNNFNFYCNFDYFSIILCGCVMV